MQLFERFHVFEITSRLFLFAFTKTSESSLSISLSLVAEDTLFRCSLASASFYSDVGSKTEIGYIQNPHAIRFDM